MVGMASLQDIADAVVRRAQRQGFVVPRDVRSELHLAGLEEDLWKEVLGLAKHLFNYRQGRYYHLSTALSPQKLREQERQRAIEKAIRLLIREHRQAEKHNERRQQSRVDFIQPILVRADDGKEWTLLSRDISTTGIRIIGTKQLLGQKVRVQLPGTKSLWVVVRILWTGAIADNLFENGGSFLELVEETL